MGDKTPGPTCQAKDPVAVKDGTMCLAPTPVPGSMRAQSPSGDARKVILMDEDVGQCRTISIDSEEFVNNYVDNNIVSVDYWSTAYATQEKRYREFWVNYKDGRRLKLNTDVIPVRRRIVQMPGYRGTRLIFKPGEYRKRSGFIYPDIYGEGSTPTLIDIATTIVYNHRQREQFLEVAELTFQFAVILSSYATPPEMPKSGGGGLRLPGLRPNVRRVTWQNLAEWEQLELAGLGPRVPKAVREGGHLLEKHVYITDAALEARAATTTEKIATKFTDADTAVNAINQVIEKNWNKVRAFLSKLKPGEAEYLPLHDTFPKGRFPKGVGHGYQVLATGEVQRVEALYDVVVFVQADGTGGWLVRSAFPTIAEVAKRILMEK